MIVSSIALCALGGASFAVPALLAITAQILVEKKCLPEKVCILMEKYLPLLASIGLVIGSPSWIVTTIAALSILSLLSGSFQKTLNENLDALFQFFLFSDCKGPSLKELNKKATEKTQLSYDAIVDILEHPEYYEMNPAHCSKNVALTSELPKNSDYEQFDTLFHSINWTEKYTHIFNKLQDDDRFCFFIKDTLGEEVDEEILQTEQKKCSYEERKEYIEICIQKIAKKADMDKEMYVTHWITTQMEGMVQVLMGKKMGTGTMADLLDARDHCQQIIPFLKTLESQIEKEGILLELAVGGGSYCNDGIKRTAKDILDNILLQGGGEGISPLKQFENTIRQRLQQQRKEFVEQVYNKGASSNAATKKVKSGLHTFNMSKKILSLGIHPLTEREKNHLSFVEFFFWEYTKEYRNMFFADVLPSKNAKWDKKRGEKGFSKYDLYGAFREDEAGKTGTYYGTFLKNNEKLSEEQGEYLTNEIITKLEDYNKSFQTLMLVSLGIMKRKKSAPRVQVQPD